MKGDLKCIPGNITHFTLAPSSKLFGWNRTLYHQRESGTEDTNEIIVEDMTTLFRGIFNPSTTLNSTNIKERLTITRQRLHEENQAKNWSRKK